MIVMVSLAEVPNTVILFVVIAIVAAIGLQVVGDMQEGNVTGEVGCNATDTSGCGSAYNATANVQDGAVALFGFMPTIGLVLAATIIIGLVVRSFMTK